MVYDRTVNRERFVDQYPARSDFQTVVLVRTKVDIELEVILRVVSVD